MANLLLNKYKKQDRDPFKDSDRRNPIGRWQGKGDWDRSDPTIFRSRFPKTMGKKLPGGRFRKTY